MGYPRRMRQREVLAVTLDEKKAAFAKLAPRSAVLATMLIVRSELSVVDVATLLHMSIGNARKRLRSIYPMLEVENRRHLGALYLDVVEADEREHHGNV